jgi:hypothetical protein
MSVLVPAGTQQAREREITSSTRAGAEIGCREQDTVAPVSHGETEPSTVASYRSRYSAVDAPAHRDGAQSADFVASTGFAVLAEGRRVERPRHIAVLDCFPSSCRHLSAGPSMVALTGSTTPATVPVGHLGAPSRHRPVVLLPAGNGTLELLGSALGECAPKTFTARTSPRWYGGSVTSAYSVRYEVVQADIVTFRVSQTHVEHQGRQRCVPCGPA